MGNLQAEVGHFLRLDAANAAAQPRDQHGERLKTLFHKASENMLTNQQDAVSILQTC